MKALNRLSNRPAADWVALAEAVADLSFAGLLVRFVPYRWWSALLGAVAAGDGEVETSDEDGATTRVAWAVAAVARRLPWAPVCLPRAMCAKWMLERRRVPCTLLLGIRRSSAGAIRLTDLHAWLRVGDRIVTGGDVAGDFAVIAHYRTAP